VPVAKRDLGRGRLYQPNLFLALTAAIGTVGTINLAGEWYRKPAKGVTPMMDAIPQCRGRAHYG
jgi:hypothetical protein